MSRVINKCVISGDEVVDFALNKGGNLEDHIYNHLQAKGFKTKGYGQFEGTVTKREDIANQEIIYTQEID